ncbi:hypothetical protein [Corynebacterium freiburgense]|uniref:hypothetical protein n=1 Tax=Corynebacterium freiburgense TaxID=556548 RepID=UPI0003FB9B08|nr:hypothetical protein [Corynebacterium freiburgense]WJZ03297.1 hypothetical protein CFREI_10115 [Corynebacterium freiburgense]
MENLHWGARQNAGSKVTIPLLQGGEEVATFTMDKSDKTTTAKVGERTWELTVEPKKEARAKIAVETSKPIEYSAVPEEGRFDRAKRIRADLGGTEFTLVNEAKTDWVVLDAEGEKVGQFTGANHGVRHVELEIEPGAEVSQDQAVFLAWLARIALEARLVGSTWILTVSLLVLSPIIIWIFLL